MDLLAAAPDHSPPQRFWPRSGEDPSAPKGSTVLHGGSAWRCAKALSGLRPARERPRARESIRAALAGGLRSGRGAAPALRAAEAAERGKERGGRGS